MSKNIVYEVTRLVSDKSTIQKDITTAKDIVKTMFEEKYMSKVDEALKTHQALALEQPTKEVELLKAMKNFVPIENHAKVEEMIDTMVMMTAFSNISNEVNASKSKLLKPEHSSTPSAKIDPSVHKDGVYDKDILCASKGSGKSKFSDIFMLLAMSKNMK
jgi:hypothetical protein